MKGLSMEVLNCVLLDVVFARESVAVAWTHKRSGFQLVSYVSQVQQLVCTLWTC